VRARYALNAYEEKTATQYNGRMHACAHMRAGMTLLKQLGPQGMLPLGKS